MIKYIVLCKHTVSEEGILSAPALLQVCSVTKGRFRVT